MGYETAGLSGEPFDLISKGNMIPGLAELPPDLQGVASAVFGERTGDILEPAVTVVEVEGARVAGWVEEAYQPSGKTLATLHTAALTTGGELIVRSHAGDACSGRCVCYRIVAGLGGGVMGENPHRYGFLFGQPDPKEQHATAVIHAREQLEIFARVSASTDPFSAFTPGVEEWSRYFAKHELLGDPVIEAFERTARQRGQERRAA